MQSINKNKIIVIMILVTLVFMSLFLFCISAENKKTQPVNENLKEYEMCIRLKQYMYMTVSEFREKVNSLVSKDENYYLSSFDKIAADNNLDELSTKDDDAYFLLYVLLPVMRQNWESGSVHNSINLENCSLEYAVNYSILNGSNLKMEEFKNIPLNLKGELQTNLSQVVSEEADSKQVEELINIKIKELLKKYSNENIQITLEAVELKYLAQEEQPNEINADAGYLENKDLLEEDEMKYLLSLMADNYKDMPVKEFDEYIQNFASEEEEKYIAATAKFVNKENLPEEEYEFLTITLPASNIENTVSVKNDFSDTKTVPEYRKIITRNIEQKIEATLDFKIIYTLDQDKIQVKERDQRLLSIINHLNNLLETASVDDLADRSTFMKNIGIENLEEKYSDDLMKIELEIHYDVLDLRKEE